MAFHQKGDYVRYDGPWGAVVLELAPDNYPQGLWIWGEAKVRTDHASFQGDLDALVREQLRETPLPSAATLDRETIATTSACGRRRFGRHSTLGRRGRG